MKKTLICAAAVVTCCLGNNYPAHAKEADRWDQGYASGIAIQACVIYAEGRISRTRFVEEVQRAQKYLADWQQDGLIFGFRDSATGKGSAGAKRTFRQCYDASQHLLNNFNSSYGSRI